MANEDLYDIKPKCIICTTEIPAAQLRFKPVTCSKECSALLARLHRARYDKRACRFCHKASTPNSRRAFSRFRKWERENPELARPVEYTIATKAGMTAWEFSLALAQAARNDIELDVTLKNYAWGKEKKEKAEREPTPELDRCLAILAAYVPPVKETPADATEAATDL